MKKSIISIICNKNQDLSFKKFTLCILIFLQNISFAQEPVTNRQGREITVNTPASTTEPGIVKLAGHLGGTADAPTVPGLATKQDVLTLTTTGSGNATLTGATLNIPPQSNKTPFNLQGTNTDVGDNKTDKIWRTGGIMLGDGVSSSTNFDGYFYARGNMTANPTIFAFENTQTAGTGIFAGNGGGTNFLPNLRLSSSGGFRSIIIGEIQTDSGTEPAIQFRAQIQGLGALVNRPSFTWANGIASDSEQMRLTANGRLAINNTTPLGRLTVDDKSYITNLPTSSANLTDETFRPHTRFQNTVGANNNALSLYSTTTSWGMQSHNYSTGVALPIVLQPASGFVGVNVTNPVSTFANTSSVITGSNISSAINGGFTWVASGSGFAGGIYNANPDGNGFLIKNNATGATNNVLEVATGTQSTTVSSLFNVKGNGFVGVNTNSPSDRFTVQETTTAASGAFYFNPSNNPASTTITGQVKLGPSSDWFGTIRNVVPAGLNADQTDIQITTGQASNNNTQVPRVTVKGQTGRVGIGTTAPGSTLEVNGSATNTAAFNSGTANTILFNNSNLAYTNASHGSFILQGMKDGGTYTLAVQSLAQGASTFSGLNPTNTPFNFRYINNSPSIAGTHTLYTFVVMGTTVYVYTNSGFAP